MGILEFIVRTLEHVVWPIVTLTIIMKFANEFRLFLKRIKYAKYKDFEIQLEKEPKEVVIGIRKPTLLRAHSISLPVGSDFDMTIVYREFANFDKLIQNAGRINRINNAA